LLPPRYRWIKLFLIAYAVSMSVVFAVFIIMWSHDRPEDRPPFTLLTVLKGMLVILITFVISFLIVGVRFANSQYPVELELEEFQSRIEASTNTAKGPHDYPGVTVIPDYSTPTDGPGRYRIHGVDRNTKNDVVRDIEADSAANAKVKAEVNDIIVTSITKTA